MRRIAIGVAMTVTLASGCLSASRKLETPAAPEHSLANPAGGSSAYVPSAGGATESGNASAAPFGFRNKKAVPDSVMFGNQPESSYRDSPIP